MSEELFDKNERGGGRREGYTPQSNGGYQRQGGQPRARFNRDARVTGSSYPRKNYGENRQGGYAPRYNSEEGGEGGYQQRPYRSSYNNNRQGGNYQGGNYQSRGNYQQGGYRNNDNRWNKRPSYNNEEGTQEGGYQQRPYRSFNGENQGNGGYNPRGGYQQGGFRPRTQGGFNSNRPRRTNNGYDPHAKYSQKKRLEYKEENYDPNEPVRLNKFLANAGVCSRRDADKYIEAGVVTVNGEVVTELGTKVLRTDTVLFHDNAIKMEKKVYVLLNKPKGYVTTSEDPQNRKTVMDLVKDACPERIYPVGRLDRNTTGVLLFTNDGEMASRLTHPKFLKKKIYHVYTDQNVTAADLRQIAEGITLEDGEIKADAVEYASETDKKQVGIEIHSGKNRIVRRIFEHLGYHVVKLDRVYFAGLTKKNVRRGDWRYLTEKEVTMLRMGAFE